SPTHHIHLQAPSFPYTTLFRSDKSIHELQELVKKIALKEKIEESKEFASDVQQSLHSGLAAKTSGVRDRGVKKAPFVVLIGANRSEEHTSELQSRFDLVCRLLL